MSAAFKNAKKKLSQNELRKLMNDHKSKSQKALKKIETPLAKYNEAGQLTCVLCNSIVRSENVWTVHINSKQHRENVEMAKKLKERTNNFTKPLKRPLTPPTEESPKRLKSILKNGTKPNEATNKIPEDFFDKNALKHDKDASRDNRKGTKLTEEPMDAEVASAEVLPEGFFDDPKLDAKARNLEYKDPVEEEWERFQREIRDADNKSAAIIAEDQDEATSERQLDEIDEQIKNWSRVVTLEKKKVEIIDSTSENMERMNIEEAESSDNEDFDEFLDWRAKKSFK